MIFRTKNGIIDFRAKDRNRIKLTNTEKRYNMAKIIAVANQKGGVGKTTTAVNLASSLAEKGKKVLLMDLDPQGNATSGCGVRKKHISHSAYDLLLDPGTALKSAAVPTEFRNLDIVPSTMDLAGAELELAEKQHRALTLKNKLCGEETNKYDYIIADCPPSLGLITINALSAADSVLIPIQCEFYALEGLSQLTNTIKQVKKLYNRDLDIEGVLVTMFDGRLNLTLQVMAEVKKYFAEKTFSTVIPRNVRISEAPSHGKPINYYDKYAKGAAAYMELAQEIIKRNA